MEKKERLKSLIEDLNDGIDEEKVKVEFKKEFGHVSSSEISEIEQELIKEGTTVAEIQKLCNVHASVFSGNISDLHTLDEVDRQWGHPLFIFRKENQGILKYLDEKFYPAFDLYKEDDSEENKIDLMSRIKTLSKVKTHYERKENVFFPFLEKAGINGIPQVMWGKDDEIKDIFTKLMNEDLNKEDFIKTIDLSIEEVLSMITKEDEILSPILVKTIKGFEWLTIAKVSSNVGYIFTGGIEGASLSDAEQWIKENSLEYVDESLENEDEEEIEDGYIKLPSGLIKVKDLTVMLNAAPYDITFIDKDDKVAYFSEGKDMMFERTRTIIGRDVRMCHPPKIVGIVEELIKDFKAGIKDEEIRILTPGTKVNLVRYYAVRDDDGKYIGTLEVTEEISSIVDMVNEIRNK